MSLAYSTAVIKGPPQPTTLILWTMMGFCTG